jgi:hypothetical protein
MERCCDVSLYLSFIDNVLWECDETVLWFGRSVFSTNVTLYKHFENTFAG